MSKGLFSNSPKGASIDLSSSESSLSARNNKSSLNERLGSTRERIENDVILNTTYNAGQSDALRQSLQTAVTGDESLIRDMNVHSQIASVQDAKASRIRRRKKSLFEAIGETEEDSIEQIQLEISRELDSDSGLTLAKEVVQQQLEREDALEIKTNHAKDAALGAFRGEVAEYEFDREKEKKDKDSDSHKSQELKFK